MNKQDKQEPGNQQSVIEDLTVNEAHASEVKGGPRGGGGNIIVFDIVDSCP